MGFEYINFKKLGNHCVTSVVPTKNPRWLPSHRSAQGSKIEHASISLTSMSNCSSGPEIINI